MIIGRNGFRWVDMIKKPSVLVVGHDQEGLVPSRRVPHRVIDLGDELLACTHLVRWVLVVGLAEE